MEVAGCVQAKGEAEDLPVTQAPPDVGGRVALQDAEVLAKDLTEGPVGDAPPVRQAAPGAAKRFGTLVSQPLPEFADQPSLPDAGVAHEGNDLWAPILRHPLVRDEQPLEVLVPPDEGLAQSVDPTRAHQRKRPDQPPAAHPSGLALRLHRGWLRELEGASGC